MTPEGRIAQREFTAGVKLCGRKVKQGISEHYLPLYHIFRHYCKRVSAQRSPTCLRPRTTSRPPNTSRDLRASNSLGLRATNPRSE